LVVGSNPTGPTSVAVIRTFLLLAAASGVASAATVTFYSAKDLAGKTATLHGKGEPFASEDLGHFGKTHYTMLAYRSTTGSAEVHQGEADLFVIVSGSGSLAFGGKLVQSKQTKPGEFRGASISGGEKRPFGVGDVLHIPAGVPHQMLVDAGKPVSYFVLKVTGQ
jgi:mannose-6-phosphate isomerase-like protein (cupin superfamily)